jgi:DNA polymerase
MGADKAEGYAGGLIDHATAEKIVKTYRAENKEIVGWWYKVEEAFTYTARYKKPCQLPKGVAFRSEEECDVIVTLPNGRELKYHRVKLKQTEDQYGRPKTSVEVYNDQTHSWGYTWGGSLAENVVQAVSRDILGEAILRLEGRGFHVALHQHDEVVIPSTEATAALRSGIEELCRIPSWAPGIPLSAEGVVSKQFGRH